MLKFIAGKSGASGPSQHWLAMAAVAAIAGLAIPFYVAHLGAKPAPLLALPILVVLGILLFWNRMLLLLLILLFRSVGDLVLESTRFSLGGQELGVGTLLNAFVILTVMLFVLEKPTALPRRAVAMWAGFVAATLLSVLYSPEKGGAIRQVLSLFSYFAVFAGAFYFVNSREHFRRALQLVLLSSVLPVMYAAVEIALNAGSLAGFRLESTFQHPNIFAFYLVLVIALSLYFLKGLQDPTQRTSALAVAKRYALGCYMVVLAVMLAATKTRSAWLACFAIFAAYAFLFERRYLAYLLLAVVLALLVPGIRERVADVGVNSAAGPYVQLDSFSWRVQAWQASLKWMEPSHYLTGYGMDAFHFHSLQFSPFFGKEGFYAHNVYVQLFFDTGLIGLLAYLWIFAQMLLAIKALQQKDRLAAFVISALVVAYLVVSFSDNMLGYLVFNWYFWFVCGAAWALAQRESAAGTPAAKPADMRGATWTHKAAQNIEKAAVRQR